VIRVHDVTFSFPGRKVLDSLSIEIEEALTTVVIGRSGIGKSVLLRCITGLLRPQSGSIDIDGQEVVGAGRQELLEIRKRIGMLFQEGALFDSMNVYDNVAFPLVYHKSSTAKEIGFRVQTFLELVGMTEWSHARPQELSGGMKRKVAVARAMILEPKYLLYDEPTAGLDPESAAIVEATIKRLQKERSMTSLVVTHDIDLTQYIGDRIALIDEGRIVAFGDHETSFRKGSPVYIHFFEKRERIRQGNGNQD
jgi:phospholipid/cholesterol/gamma-HCH transport system ATP-binding protein